MARVDHDLSDEQWAALSKWNDEVTGWLRRRRLDERAFLLRRLEVCTALLQE